MLVDRETRALTSGATEILEELHPGGEHPTAKKELLQSTIEVITGVCQNVREATADLAGTLEKLVPLAEARGLGLMCAGTHPDHELAHAAGHRQPALRQAHLGHAVAGPPDADLRRARARRRALAGQGHRDGERAVRVHPALPRAVGELAVLGGR
jgi:hypothetical protein